MDTSNGITSKRTDCKCVIVYVAPTLLMRCAARVALKLTVWAANV
jgi:hypothetical protein